MLEGCGEKVCFQCLFESGKQVGLRDVDWQSIPQLGTCLGKPAVSSGCAGSWDSQLQTFRAGPQWSSRSMGMQQFTDASRGWLVARAVDLQQDLENDMLLHGQPVKLFQNWRNMCSPNGPGG